MSNIIEQATTGAAGVWATIGAFLAGILMMLPKLLNMRKADTIDGSILKRVEAHEQRLGKMDKLIHRQQIRLTRFEVTVLHLVALLKHNSIDIPPFLVDEINDLTSGRQELKADDEPQ